MNKQKGTGYKLPDIKPTTNISYFNREKYKDIQNNFPIRLVSIAAGMAKSFIHKVCGHKDYLNVHDIFNLLDQDCYRETIVPRSMVLDYLLKSSEAPKKNTRPNKINGFSLLEGHVIDKIATFPRKSIRCVVTSTPYWGLRIYKDPYFVRWADDEFCPLGHEQTPEGFLRHSTEVLAALYDILSEDGSIWWNVMDSFNTRTQIRNNAMESLKAMQGKDSRSWSDHECRRYSAGHAYLKDGEQCLIPIRIAERASRIGYYVKTVITWAKTSTLPEPQESRVSKNLEYVLHLTKIRAPLFNKSIYHTLPTTLGGRNVGWETNKLSDIWILPTSSGRDGHGAQFPISLPGRCIALSTNREDVVLDPFVGAGNSGVAARSLGRLFIGIDVCKEYLEIANKRISEVKQTSIESLPMQIVQSHSPKTLPFYSD